MFRKIVIPLGLVMAMFVSLIPREAQAGFHCDIKCIWTKIVQRNPSVPGICYVQIPAYAVDTALKYVWSNYASEVSSNQEEELATLTNGSFSFGGGFGSSGSGDIVMVRQVGEDGSFAVFGPDEATSKAVSENLYLGNVGDSGVSSNEIAAAVKKNVIVRPRGLSFAENKKWLDNRQAFFDETWKAGYAQSLTMQKKVAEASSGAHTFVTTIGDVGGDPDDSDGDIRLMMEKYKDSLAALEGAKLLALQAEASAQVIEAAEGMITKRTDDYENYEGNV
ncbi:MAG: hypothetical protein GY804_05695 [Alphaproteobacteria bacterium]|nr:hypothetical protein [Alphaproteobacteria bacterium]